MVARVPVLEVRPCLDRGRFPAKVVPGEPLTVEALVLPDTVEVGAAVVLTGPDGERRDPVPMQHLGDHVWSATVSADEVGAWTYHVESWQESVIAPVMRGSSFSMRMRLMSDAPLEAPYNPCVETRTDEGGNAMPL